MSQDKQESTCEGTHLEESKEQGIHHQKSQSSSKCQLSTQLTPQKLQFNYQNDKTPLKYQKYVWTEGIPYRKSYIDYQPEVSFEQQPYERTFIEKKQDGLGQLKDVKKTITDYKTIQHINYKPITKYYLDYKKIEHKTEYIPEISYQTSTKNVMSYPFEKYLLYIVNQSLKKGSLCQWFQSQSKQYQTKLYINQSNSKVFFLFRVQKYVEFKTKTILSESNVKQPIVKKPDPVQTVVQHSIHEPEANKPEQKSFMNHDQELQKKSIKFVPIKDTEFSQKRKVYLQKIQNKTIFKFQND